MVGRITYIVLAQTLNHAQPIVLCISFAYLLVNGNVQEIDSLLAGGLTDEDEDDVLQELEQIIKVYFVYFIFLQLSVHCSSLSGSYCFGVIVV